MKLAFEVTRTINKQPTGINRYARHLIAAVAAEATDTDIELYYHLTKLTKRKYWFRPDGISTKIHLENHWPVFNMPDVVHGLDGYVPEWRKAKRVVTIHDIFPLIKDEDIVSPKGFRDKIRVDYARAIAVADRVVAVSESTRRDVIEYFNVDESKIITVYPGYGLRDTSDAPDTIQAPADDRTRSYLIFLGAVSGRKNTERIVRAYARSKAKNDFDLLLIGSLAYKGESTIKAIEELGLEDRVTICGYVPDVEMIKLFRNASGLVFPTLYEGFGFPILEAMMLEVPVLTSNIGSAVEISGGHTVLADPYDVDSMAAGIDKLVESNSIDTVAAKNHAMEFTWKKCATKLLGIYGELQEEL